MAAHGKRTMTGALHQGCLVTALLAIAGCSNVPSNIVPVSGRVTLDGQPLALAVVTFQPARTHEAGPPTSGGSTGRTDAEGRFSLMLIDPPVPGALVGRHSVSITTATTTGDDRSRPTGERVPAAWRNGSQMFDVPSQGTSAANFDLRGG